MTKTERGNGALASLIDRIQKLYYVEAGEPGFEAIERVSGRIHAEFRDEDGRLRVLPRSTACDLVRNRHGKVPSWQAVRMFVLVCHRIAVESDLGPEPLDDLRGEFRALWQAAKDEERSASPADAETTGDILAPAPGETPARFTATMRLMPVEWGRVGARRVERAETGEDPKAAYELAVLFACEAHGAGDGEEEREKSGQWLRIAEHWKARATGKVPQAAALRLRGASLVNAARALAIEYKQAGRSTRNLFLGAVAKAEASVDSGVRYEQRQSSRIH
ncbi:hypothetical protein HNP84_004494 [Thermocatellispora tengchongensis]|uniref:Uncharacterized protein n=1 Tax=Thermocatellispora tengchongensis TaxID=1073253 RepID=A0A840PBG8_9ACTN|nr:hypothetical protein [Thermocatellispora tengchongensis]MBB5134760.1 hypothetical protein [Thermocatellispora tengchongensis]